MTTSTAIFLLVIVIVVLAMCFFVVSQLNLLKDQLKNNNNDAVLVEWLKEMKGTVSKNSDVLSEQLRFQREAMNKQTQLIWERLDKSAEIILGVQQHLGGLQEFTKDMKDLSNVLKSPKLRGGLGEQFLYEILANFLPTDLYKTQYKFRSGDVCDAVIKTDKGLIPVDSKFPLENFKLMQTLTTDEERDKAKKQFVKDVKKRIDEIALKYILPAQGTTEQAVMYVPSENIYYELIVHTSEIEEYAKNKNIVMASPNTLTYFLKVILVAYQQQQLEQHASVILKNLAGLKIEANKFFEDINVLDGHLVRASKSMENVKNKYNKLYVGLNTASTVATTETLSLEEGIGVESVDTLLP